MNFNILIFSSPRRSPGRAIVLPPASALTLATSALAKCYSFYVNVFYVMGKALSGELSCPCGRSCLIFIVHIMDIQNYSRIFWKPN